MSNVSCTYLYTPDPDVAGYEIFVDHVSIAFVPYLPGQSPTEALTEPLLFLGFTPAHCARNDFRAGLVDEYLAISRQDIASVTETWLWDDRLARGELEKFRGIATR